MDAATLAKRIIKDNIYLTLSTTDGTDPWAATLQYVVDEQYNFYFISSPDSLHAQHIQENPNVTFTIYDSRQPSGTGEGIQASGKARILPPSEYPQVVIDYFKILESIGIAKEKNAIFKIVPEHFFVPDTEFWKAHGVDRRIEVALR